MFTTRGLTFLYLGSLHVEPTCCYFDHYFSNYLFHHGVGRCSMSLSVNLTRRKDVLISNLSENTPNLNLNN